MEAFNLLPDPQTNGGLLIAIAPESFDELVAIFREASLDDFLQPIGSVTEEQEKKIMVKQEIF